MDPGYGTPRSVDAVDPTASYDTWPTLPSTRESRGSRCFCCRWRLSWSAVSVVEIALELLTVVLYFFFTKTILKRMLPAGTVKDEQVTPLSEWMLRMVGSMTCVQIVLLIAGIGWGNTITRKIIYWGMLTGDILFIAIQAAFVHSMSEWNAVNIAMVTLASAFGLFRVITLIFDPVWWLWVPDPNYETN